MWEPSQATLDIGLCTSFVVERVPPQGAPTCGSPKVPSEQFNKRVLLCDTGEVRAHIWSNDLLLLPPSMRKSVKPWGECWNHYQGTKKLEVKLTPGKIRCLRVDRARPFRALAFTYKLQSAVDTSNSAWTQVNSEWSHGLRPDRTPVTSVFPRCHLGRCLVVRQST